MRARGARGAPRTKKKSRLHPARSGDGRVPARGSLDRHSRIDRALNPPNPQPPTPPRLDTPPTPPPCHPNPRHPHRLTLETPVLPPLPRRVLRAHGLRHEPLRNPDPRLEPRRNHERPPLRPMRSQPFPSTAPDPQNGAQTAAQAPADADTAAAADRQMNRRVRRLVADDLPKERVRRFARAVVEEPGREGDLGTGRMIGAEGAAVAGVRPDADALREQGHVPEHRPGVEPAVQGLEVSDRKLAHEEGSSTLAGRCRSDRANVRTPRVNDRAWIDFVLLRPQPPRHVEAHRSEGRASLERFLQIGSS
jgi:hypothetical protein